MKNAERKVRYYFEEGYDHLLCTDDRDDGTTVYEADRDRMSAGAGIMYVGDEDAVVSIEFGLVMVYEAEDGNPQTVQLENSGAIPSVEPPTDPEDDF